MAKSFRRWTQKDFIDYMCNQYFFVNVIKKTVTKEQLRKKLNRMVSYVINDRSYAVDRELVLKLIHNNESFITETEFKTWAVDQINAWKNNKNLVLPLEDIMVPNNNILPSKNVENIIPAYTYRDVKEGKVFYESKKYIPKIGDWIKLDSWEKYYEVVDGPSFSNSTVYLRDVEGFVYQQPLMHFDWIKRPDDNSKDIPVEQPFGYHLVEIKKGTYGESSKIREEFEEFVDSMTQNNPIMAIHELADLIGAIEGFVKKHNYTLDDLITMKDATKRSFESGRRK